MASGAQLPDLGIVQEQPQASGPEASAAIEAIIAARKPKKYRAAGSGSRMRTT